MSLYRYEALSPSGKTVTGVIDADSLSTAKEKLRQSRVLVVDLIPFQEKKKEISMPPSFLLDFTRMLGQLLRAGIPLYESLVIMEEKYHEHRFHPVLIDLCDTIKAGKSLSEAMRKYPLSFDPVYIAMVHAGEQTASLPTIFDELCALLQRQQKLKKDLFSAAAYPLFLGCFCVAVFFALLLFVIPSMKALFEGRELHSMTRFVFGASDILIAHGVYLAAGLIFLLLGFFFILRYPPLKPTLDKGLLRLPLLGAFLKEAAIIRFCRTSAVLLSGGLPILQTLQLSRHVIKNRVLESIIANAQQKVSEGKSLSEELKSSSYIPSLLPRMLAIAEQTGKTAVMLQSIGNICEEILEKRLKQFTAILQPALLLLLGVIVGIVLLSILIPLTDVGSILQT